MLNIFPRIITFEVNLKPTEIMQAIHDNINKETSFLKTMFNSKRLEGTTSGKQFDVNLTNEESLNKANQIFLHGEIKELENGFTEIEISCYPYPRLLLGLLGGTLFPFFLIVAFFPSNNILFEYGIIAKFPIFIVTFTINFYLLSWLFMSGFNRSLSVLKQILQDAEKQKNR